MAELNARIIAKASATASEEPLAADLEVAELAVNTADGKLFTKHTDGSIVAISGGGGGGASKLGDLTDVDAAGPTDGQVLTWVDANSQWEPAGVSGSGAVDSVNSQTGAVSLGIQDMNDFEYAIIPSATTYTLSGPSSTIPDASGKWAVGSALNNYFTWYDTDPINDWLGSIGTGVTMEFVTQDGYVHTAVNSSVAAPNGGTADYMSFAGYPWPSEITTAMSFNQPITVRLPGALGTAPTDEDILQWSSTDSKFVCTGGFISKATLQAEVAASTDFADFQSRIAAL